MNEPRKRSADTAAADPLDPEVQLERLRAEIDGTDRAILEQLNQRARLVGRVGEVKRASRLTIYAAARERDLVERLASENRGPFPSDGLWPVFREIISATRSLELTLRVAYLGPEGTFSHLAARQTFGSLAEYVAVPSIPEVFAAVERGEADHGLVPVENTSEGIVTRTLDTCAGSDLAICGETLLRISNHLISRTGRLDDIRRVASHPQALAQCQGWLDRQLPGVELVEAASTVAAARLAAEAPDVAAVGGSLAAELSGLTVVAASIEDRRDNTTRFLVIGGESPAPSGNDLTSVVFTVRKHQPGALHRLLEPFSRLGVNVTSIQSRPLRGTPWEYLFFIDLEGHRSDPSVAEALEQAGRLANSHRVLGSFPRAARVLGREDGA